MDEPPYASGSSSDQSVTAYQYNQPSPLPTVSVDAPTASTVPSDLPIDVPVDPLPVDSLPVDAIMVPPVDPVTATDEHIITQSDVPSLNGEDLHQALLDAFRPAGESDIVMQDAEQLVPDQVAQYPPAQPPLAEDQQPVSGPQNVVDTEPQPDVGPDPDIQGARIEAVDDEEDNLQTSGRTLRTSTRAQVVGLYKERNPILPRRKPASMNKGKVAWTNKQQVEPLTAPDLPLPNVADNMAYYSRNPKSVTPMVTVNPEVLSPDVVRVRLHCANPESAAVNFEFRAPKSAVSCHTQLQALFVTSYAGEN
jgi:hypothetical protein